MKEKTHILFLLLLATAFILVLGYLGIVLLPKGGDDSAHPSETSLPAEDENFTFGNGEKSAANWQACRNQTVNAYNEKIRNHQDITPEDQKRHQRRLKYCNTLFP